jgi:hypothetical protein
MKVQYFTACTMDGFIADENNSLDWLFEAPHDPDDHFWDEWFPTVGGLVWGATTYEGHIERSGLGADSGRFTAKRPPSSGTRASGSSAAASSWGSSTTRACSTS